MTSRWTNYSDRQQASASSTAVAKIHVVEVLAVLKVSADFYDKNCREYKGWDAVCGDDTAY